MKLTIGKIKENGKV